MVEVDSRQEIRAIEECLRSKFMRDARVVNPENGYLSLPWINEVIDPGLQSLAARMIGYLLQQRLEGDQRVTKVAGVPTMGTYLAVAMAETLDVPLAATRKGRHVPSRWEEAVVLEKDMKPYQNGVPAAHIYNGIHLGDGVLLADDILGDGTTLQPIVKWMLDYGITPYVGVYAAKLYRPGYEAVRKLGVEPIYVYGIEQVTQAGEVVLAPPQIT